MKKFTISMPIVGVATATVKADSESEAIEELFAVWDNSPDDVHVEWEFVEHVTTGNVFHGMQNDVEVYEEE